MLLQLAISALIVLFACAFLIRAFPSPALDLEVDLANELEVIDFQEDDDQQSSTGSFHTDIVEDEYYLSRQGDLAAYAPRRRAGQKRGNLSTWLKLTPPDSTSDFRKMAEPSQPTQQATQPVEDPRKMGRHLSDVSEDDTTDVICILHPNSHAAFKAVRANMFQHPEHILQNHDLDEITSDDQSLPEFQKGREIALRMSSNVRQPTEGFIFGRNPAHCDILLTDNSHDKLISNKHFKIFVNGQGSLMLQDLSTNGTIVDDDHLRTRGRHGQGTQKPAMRTLNNGAIICVIGEPNKTEIKLIVRIPNRGDNEEIYEQNLRKYLEARGKVAQFTSIREATFGNHWNGGAKYNFTGLLGKGAFATVYRVQTKREGEMYAAKELDKRRFIKNGILDIKFDSELNIMKDLKHPNIVEYFECVHYEHWVYIIMECIPFGELSQELRTRGVLPEDQVQTITKQILHALDYLHRGGITHRDIKPDNILISSRDPLIVKLSDFGLSKCVSDQETFLKTFCGTLLYCAPEIYPDYANYTTGVTPKRRRVGEAAPRTSPYDQSVDMWSFGAVIFHLLCGQAPVTGRGDDRGAQMLNNIMTKDIDFRPLRNQGVDENAIDFVAKLLNRSPHLRPREAECLKHPWLRNVTDPFNYEEYEPAADAARLRLQPVEEGDEDIIDRDLIEDLGQLTQHPESSLHSTPKRPVKRPRTGGVSPTTPHDITYPVLPSNLASSPPQSSPGARLFGEITQSAVLRSSGIFGAQSPVTPTGVIPDIQNRVARISVNDFGGFSAAESMESADISGQPLQYPTTLAIPQTNVSGSAPSLLGAEAQIGQLNMTSPEPDVSDAQTPETANPVTPQTREMSPSSSVTKSVGSEQIQGQSSAHPGFSRNINLDLINDNAAFAAEIAAREAARAERVREKAQTFQAASRVSRGPPPSLEFAKTIDVRNTEVRREVPIQNPRLIKIRSSSQSSDFIKPNRRFGRLTTVPGSFANLTINLEDRLTTWGRGPDCSVPYEDKKDTRVPKYGLKVAFWAPGIEKFVKGGGDWKQYSGIYTIVATSATKCIWVNGIILRKESEDGGNALFGKIYTGDVITIHESTSESNFLRFKVEITFGDSARPRPDEEAGFNIQMEGKYHKIQKERESVRHSRGEHSDMEAMTRTEIAVE